MDQRKLSALQASPLPERDENKFPTSKGHSLATRISAATIDGTEGLAVTVEVDTSRGLPGFHLVGLPGKEVRESRERVLAALRNCGIRPPVGKITVNLAPAGVPKEGAAFDLAIAVGIVVAGKGSDADHLEKMVGKVFFLGELSLFGELQPVKGLLAMVLAAAQVGATSVVVPRSQIREASLVEGVQVVGAETLNEVIHWSRGGVLKNGHNTPPQAANSGQYHAQLAVKSLAEDLKGQPLVRKAAVVAAAGRHHLLMVGPPGTGKTRLARLLGRMQPALSKEQSLDVTRIHSVCGLLGEAQLVTRPPFRAPHHTITRAGLVGGGAGIRPGEVTLSHGGILFLDEMTEFAPAVLDVLREPLEEGRITVTRGGGTRNFPAEFHLIGAMNPCRCGYLGSTQRSCRCSPAEQVRYLNRLSGPLLDRFDIFVEVGPWQGTFLTGGSGFEKESPPVLAVRERDWRVKPEVKDIIEARELLDSCKLPPDAEAKDMAPFLTREINPTLETVRTTLGLSLRGVYRCLHLARTLAALDRSKVIQLSHLYESLEFRREHLWPEQL
jgi:magnesium chelatase family protein